jgi:hypothetical protein
VGESLRAGGLPGGELFGRLRLILNDQKTRNPKPEIRMKSQIRIPKTESSTEASLQGHFSDIGLGVSFGFLAWGFGFTPRTFQTG